MPIVYWIALELPAPRLTWHVTVPTVVSVELTRDGWRFEQVEPIGVFGVVLSRLMNVTRAFLMSPAVVSYADSPLTALMSLIVAVRVTVALVADVDAVQNRFAPV